MDGLGPERQVVAHKEHTILVTRVTAFETSRAKLSGGWLRCSGRYSGGSPGRLRPEAPPVTERLRWCSPHCLLRWLPLLLCSVPYRHGPHRALLGSAACIRRHRTSGNELRRTLTLWQQKHISEPQGSRPRKSNTTFMLKPQPPAFMARNALPSEESPVRREPKCVGMRTLCSPSGLTKSSAVVAEVGTSAIAATRALLRSVIKPPTPTTVAVMSILVHRK
jgi:hypothetical protein